MTTNFILAAALCAFFAIFTNSSTAQTSSEQPASAAPAPEEMLDLNAARKYMLKLINRDRATVGAPPVVLDDIASVAGQGHSDEMAVNGYVGHWALDGRKPDQRYTQAGGRDADAENVIGDLGDSGGPKFALSSTPVFSKSRLDQDEGDLFGEKPPDDLHRQNIVNPLRTHVGIGLSLALQGEDFRDSCSQEFVNHYGEYSQIPQAIRRGEKFTLTGKLLKRAHLQSVDVRWEDFPKPMTADEINKTNGYSIPDGTTADYYPDDDQHLIAVRTVDGCEEFSVDVATGRSWKPGLYYVLVWAYVNGAKDADNISTRTFLLDSGK